MINPNAQISSYLPNGISVLGNSTPNTSFAPQQIPQQSTPNVANNQNLLSLQNSAPLSKQSTPNTAFAPQQIPQQNILSYPQQIPQSIEQSALNGGGVNNKQQISNFMSALGGIGAGSNNTQINAPTNMTQPTQPLINPNVAYDNNGGSNQNYFTPTQQPNTGSVNPIDNKQQISSANQLNPNISGSLAPQTPTQTPNTGSVNAQILPNGMGNSTPPVAPLKSTGEISTQQQQPTTINPNASISSLLPNGISITSDENLKTNITPAQKNLTSFLQSLGAHNYTYKNPELDGVGTFTSPMAQELEKTELGKQAVIDTPRGKMVNYGRLGGVNLAAVATVYKETQRLQLQVDQLRKQFSLIKRK